MEDVLRETPKGTIIKTIRQVREFWENKPLGSEESSFEIGRAKFIKEHSQIYEDDCLAGQFDEATIP